MTGGTGPGDPADNAPLEHLRAAALEFVRAGQVLLAVAEKTLEDPASAADVVQRLADTGREFFAAWTGPGPAGDEDSDLFAESDGITGDDTSGPEGED